MFSCVSCGSHLTLVASCVTAYTERSFEHLLDAAIGPASASYGIPEMHAVLETDAGREMRKMMLVR